MEHLLDQSKKFVVLGPDEKIWFFVYELTPEIHGWQAYSKRPGLNAFVPEGPWLEESVYRFVNIYSRKLTDDDKIDLHLFLYKGGLEALFTKTRNKDK
jgi:hypothetical protein